MTTGTAPQADQYTTPGAFTYNVPAGRSLVFVTMQAAGCGGNGGQTGSPFTQGGGAGGAGQLCVRVPVVVTPGGTVAAGIGAGGAGAAAGGANFGAAGGDTFFGSFRVNGALQATTVGQTSPEGDAGGGINNTGPGGTMGELADPDGPTSWWAGASGGPHSSTGDVTRVGGPAGGRYGAHVSVSTDRGGGPGSSTIFAAGVQGADGGVVGANGSLGCGGGGGGGAGGAAGGTGGNGYIIVEYY